MGARRVLGGAVLVAAPSAVAVLTATWWQYLSSFWQTTLVAAGVFTAVLGGLVAFVLSAKRFVEIHGELKKAIPELEKLAKGSHRGWRLIAKAYLFLLRILGLIEVGGTSPDGGGSRRKIVLRYKPDGKTITFRIGRPGGKGPSAALDWIWVLVRTRLQQLFVDVGHGSASANAVSNRRKLRASLLVSSILGGLATTAGVQAAPNDAPSILDVKNAAACELLVPAVREFGLRAFGMPEIDGVGYGCGDALEYVPIAKLYPPAARVIASDRAIRKAVANGGIIIKRVDLGGSVGAVTITNNVGISFNTIDNNIAIEIYALDTFVDRLVDLGYRQPWADAKHCGSLSAHPHEKRPRCVYSTDGEKVGFMVGAESLVRQHRVRRADPRLVELTNYASGTRELIPDWSKAFAGVTIVDNVVNGDNHKLGAKAVVILHAAVGLDWRAADVINNVGITHGLIGRGWPITNYAGITLGGHVIVDNTRASTAADFMIDSVSSSDSFDPAPASV